MVGRLVLASSDFDYWLGGLLARIGLVSLVGQVGLVG
mgnify:FL=1